MRLKTERLWTSLTAVALLPATVLNVHAGPVMPEQTGSFKLWQELTTDVSPVVIAEAGEGEGGEGGEGGVNPASAASDPVIFLTALDIIAAHYHAGLAAYRAGDHRAGGEMFAHPISEVYVDLKPVLDRLGVEDFEGKLTRAVEVALAGSTDGDVTAAANAVFASLSGAASKAPNIVSNREAAERGAFADMINRAAAQYGVAIKPDGGEAYLDGYGFLAAARARAPAILASLEAAKSPALAAIRDGLAVLDKAYPGVKRPAQPSIEPGEALAAASKVSLALSNR